jgi:phosphate transport system protein
MERHFHEELRALRERLGAMGALVEARARDAITALLERRADLAALVASGDRAINDLELEIDDLAITLLALQSPLASDLRMVRSIIRVNADLERIGDQAVNIAHAVIRLLAKPALEPMADVTRLADVACDMLHEAVTAFSSQNTAAARAVLSRDDEADALRDVIFRTLLARMIEDPDTVERSLGLILISRSLERIADHATNIAEDLIFVVEGRVVRHQNVS